MADETTDDEVVEVLIHPSQAQYRQLAEDFEVLHAAGAESNTQAVVDAVRAQAEDVRWGELRTLRRAIADGNAAVDRKLEMLDRYTAVALALMEGREPGRTLSERLRTKHDLIRANCELRWAHFARELLHAASPITTPEGSPS